MKLKKTLALLLAMLLLAGAAAGCSSSAPADTSAVNDVAEDAAADEAPVADEAPAEEEAPVAAMTFYLGAVGPLTGGAAIYGNAHNNGSKIAVDEINALGGNIRFEYRFEDDEHDAEKSVNAYNALKDWGMQILVGPTTTNPAIAVSAEANADRIFLLTPSASSTDVTEGKDNAFQMCFTDPNQGVTAANYIHDNAVGEKVAIIYNNADAYSTGIAQAFTDTAAEIGLEIVSTTTFTDDSANDFSVQLSDARSAEADLIFLPIYYTPASLILAQAKDMEYAPIFFGVDGMDGILTLEGFDTSLAEGVMLMTPFNPWGTDDTTVNFVKAFEDAYGETPNQFAADGYDCIWAIYEAIQLAGITPDMSNEAICDALIAAFTGDLVFNGTTGSDVTWSANGEVSKAPIVVTITDDIYVNN